MVHAVIGGTGGAGSAIVRELMRRNLPVRIVTQSGRTAAPTGVETRRADATDAAALREALVGATVVYQAANVPYPEWYEVLPKVMAATIKAAGQLGSRVVYVDNLYMYGPVTAPLTEVSPQDPSTRKGALRKRLADQLLAVYAAGDVAATIGRASDYFGPGVTNAATGDRFFPPLLAGKRASWPVNADLPHSLTYIDDFARVLVTLGQRDEALGRVWHAPAAEALTGRAFGNLCAAEAGTRGRVVAMPKIAFQALALFSPLLREVGEMAYQFAAPFVIDGAHYAATFGGAPTPHPAAVAATIDWWRAQGAGK